MLGTRMRLQRLVLMIILAVSTVAQANGEANTVIYQPSAAIVCSGVVGFDDQCYGRLVVNLDGVVTYEGKLLSDLIAQLSVNADRFTVLEIGFAIEKLAVLAGDVEPPNIKGQTLNRFDRERLRANARSALDSSSGCVQMLTEFLRDPA